MAMEILVDREGEDREIYYNFTPGEEGVGLCPRIDIYKILGDDCNTDLLADYTPEEITEFEDEIDELIIDFIPWMK